MAERVGYSSWPFCYPTMFSVTCTNTAWTLAISTVSHSATLSTVPHKQHQFRPQTDTKTVSGGVQSPSYDRVCRTAEKRIRSGKKNEAYTALEVNAELCTNGLLQHGCAQSRRTLRQVSRWPDHSSFPERHLEDNILSGRTQCSPRSDFTYHSFAAILVIETIPKPETARALPSKRFAEADFDPPPRTGVQGLFFL